MTEFEVIASGLKFPEGPIAMDDGTVLLVEIARGTLSRVHPDGRVEVVADLGGGPNGAAIGPDGHCYICNSGGFGWLELDGLLYPHGVSEDYAGGRIERVFFHPTIQDGCQLRHLQQRPLGHIRRRSVTNDLI